MIFDSFDNVRAFAGDDYEAAYVPPAARTVLARFDAKSAHYTTLLTPEQTQSLLDDCDRLIDELAELTGNHELADELRKERKRASLCSLLEARQRLRDAVARAMDQVMLLETGMAHDDGGKTQD